MAKEKKGFSGSMLFFAAFMGGIFGAITGLLLAPQSGTNTRVRLREIYDRLVIEIDNIVKIVDEKAPDVLSKVASEVKEIPENVKDDMTSIKKEAEDKLSKVVNKSTTVLKEIKE